MTTRLASPRDLLFRHAARGLLIALLCCVTFAIDSAVATVAPHLSTTLNLNASVANATSKCRIVATDATLRQQVDDILARKAKLIEYNFSVKNYTVNPLASGNTWMYKSHMWSRVGTSHGQTILNLAFNYDVLSLMTLSFGVEQLDVQLQVKWGCAKPFRLGDLLLLLSYIIVSYC